MLKKFFLSCVAICFGVAQALAADNFADTWITSSQTDSTVFIIGVKPGVTLSGNVVIPSHDNKGNRIIGIGRILYNVVDSNKYLPAISNFKNITTVTLPSTLQYFYETEFLGCSGISAYYVESGSTNFAARDGVLYKYESNSGTSPTCTLVKYPPAKSGSSWSVPDDVKKIGNWAFADCMNLFNLTVPGNQKGLWTSCGTMFGNRSIRTIGFAKITTTDPDEMLQSIGGVLYNNDATQIYVVPPYNKIGNNFQIPAGVSSIRAGAFGSNAATAIIFPSNAITIEHEAFRGARFANITLPANVNFGTYLPGEGMFRDCPSLKSVDISAMSFTKVPDYLFCDCPMLSSIKLPSSAHRLGKFCFYGCKALKSMDFTAFTVYTTEETSAQFVFAYSGLESVALAGSWNCVPYAAFMGCDKLTSLDLGNGVRQIGRYGFYDAPLTKVKTNNATTINRWAFSGCPLEMLYIPEGSDPVSLGLDVASITAGRLFLGTDNIKSLESSQQWLSSIRYDSATTIYSASLKPEVFYSYRSTPWKRLMVPGAAKNGYSSFGTQDVYEMYDIQANYAKGQVYIKPADFSYVITSVKINGMTATRTPESFDYSIGAAVNSMNVEVQYSLNGTPMRTYYPTGYLTDTSGAECVNTDESGNIIEIFNLQGIRLYRGEEADVKSILPSGVYILRNFTTTRKIKI